MSKNNQNSGFLVQKISLPWFINIYQEIEKLTVVGEAVSQADSIVPIFLGQQQLIALFTDSIYVNFFRTSLEPARALNIKLLEVLNDEESDEATENQLASIRAQAHLFLQIFLAETTTLPLFLVSRKDIFDTNLLVNSPDLLYPVFLQSKCPETTQDLEAAGKALAFELPTACGFHVFRITEAVVRRYWDEVVKQPRPKVQSLGTFVAKFEENGQGDKKIVSALKQLKDLHRNPLAHPEINLTVEEAIGILGQTRSVIAPMLEALPLLNSSP